MKFFDRNLLAQYRLGNQFRCYGKIQLTLCKESVVGDSDLKSYLGLTLLGHSTPLKNTTVVSVEKQGKLQLNGALIGRGCILSVGESGSLSIGEKSYLTDGSRISARHRISIGKRCAISWGVTIIDDDGHGFGPPPYWAPVIIEDDVWIGCNVTVLKGVTLGAGSVVAAGSVVTQSCPPHSLIGGVPARVLRKDVKWLDQSR